MRVLLRSLTAAYCTADPRSLGLFRIGFGLLLLFDLVHRWVELDFWYTNQGLLPNHTLLWRPPAGHLFSLFFIASSRAEASLGFAACAGAYLLLLFGYRTGLAQVLALVCRVSLNSRISVLENGGDMVINLLCVFTLALPLGRRFSVDAWLDRLRAQPATPGQDRSRAPVVSPAVLALTLQFAAIYLFNAASKQGDAWLSGHAVHYALHQDKYVTAFGVWMREQWPPFMLQWLTWGVLATEWLSCALILTPLFRNGARLLAMCLLLPMHAAFALGLHLGAFSPAMMSFLPLLLTARHWDAIERRFARRHAATARAQPVTHALAGWAKERARPPQPRATRVRRWAVNAAVIAMMAAVGIELLNDNTSVPTWLRPPRTDWSRAMIEYPRLLQGWRMFAPDPPFEDSMIHVAAVTAEGAHVDPYNRLASRQAFPDGDTVPAHMDQSQFFSMYSERIALEGYAAYRQAFLEWLLAHPRRTGRSADCLTAFDVYLVVDRSPIFGSRDRPTPVSRHKFMEYRAPADGPCRQTARGGDEPVAELRGRTKRPAGLALPSPRVAAAHDRP
jgi:hypothetical protein